MAYLSQSDKATSEKQYVRRSMSRALLERDEEMDLARAWRDDSDEKSLHKLINAYARLVIAMASKFRHYGLPQADLVQEGNVGLMLAARRFDPERDIRFSTYATWWVKAQMQDYVLRNWSIVRTGTTSAQKSLFFNLRRMRAMIEREKGEAVITDKDRKSIAQTMGVKLKDVNNMEQRLMGGDSSLNTKIGESEDDEWMSLLADERPDPEDVVVGMRDAGTRSKWLNDALSELNTREQKIIRDRHLGQEVVTLEQLGKALGISKERVRQLESRAMIKLRSTMTKQIENPRDALFS